MPTKPVQVSASEVLELRQGTDLMRGTIKNARRLDAGLGRDSSDLDDLEAGRKALQTNLGTEDAAEMEIEDSDFATARIALRLRHGKIKKHIDGAEELELGHSEADESLHQIESLGRKFGVQLDLIEHGAAEPEPE